MRVVCDLTKTSCGQEKFLVIRKTEIRKLRHIWCRTATKTPRSTLINSKTTSRSEKREKNGDSLKKAIHTIATGLEEGAPRRGNSQNKQKSRRPKTEWQDKNTKIDRTRGDANGSKHGDRDKGDISIQDLHTMSRSLIIIEYWPNQGSSASGPAERADWLHKHTADLSSSLMLPWYSKLGDYSNQHQRTGLLRNWRFQFDDGAAGFLFSSDSLDFSVLNPLYEGSKELLFLRARLYWPSSLHCSR